MGKLQSIYYCIYIISCCNAYFIIFCTQYFKWNCFEQLWFYCISWWKYYLYTDSIQYTLLIVSALEGSILANTISDKDVSYNQPHFCHCYCWWLVLAMIQDHQFGSGSRSKPNRWQIGVLGCQYTRTVKLGTVRWKSPDPSELAGCQQIAQRVYL